MAEIPVEKKSSGALFWWLLLLAGIAALVWWLISASDETELYADADNTAVMTDVDADDAMNGAMADTITSVAVLGSLGTMIGQNVDFDNVAINRVIGDMAFTVGEGENETLVLFNEIQTPNTEKEGLVDINPGSRVDLDGEVRKLDLDEMTASVRIDIKDTPEAYIFADRVNVIGGGETP